MKLNLNEAIKQAKGRIDIYRAVVPSVPNTLGGKAMASFIAEQETVLGELVRLRAENERLARERGEIRNAARSAMDGIAKVAILVREFTSPNSVIATDILERLKRSHERLLIAEGGDGGSIT